jgi:hypothetical protein
MEHWGKIFQKGFEKFRKGIVWPSRSYHSPVPERQKEKSRIPHQQSLPYTGAKFFYLQEARKIYSTLHTGANFSIFVKKNWKNPESHPDGPREGVSPKIC